MPNLARSSHEVAFDKSRIKDAVVPPSAYTLIILSIMMVLLHYSNVDNV